MLPALRELATGELGQAKVAAVLLLGKMGPPAVKYPTDAAGAYRGAIADHGDRGHTVPCGYHRR